MLERIYFNRTPVVGVPALLASYPSDEFASRFRSTVPLLGLASAGSRPLHEVLTRCGFSEQANLHFEYQVRPAAGKGKASHTDLMVIEGPSAMAVEAKWTEPPSQSVRDWLAMNPSRTVRPCWADGST